MNNDDLNWRQFVDARHVSSALAMMDAQQQQAVLQQHQMDALTQQHKYHGTVIPNSWYIENAEEPMKKEEKVKRPWTSHDTMVLTWVVVVAIMATAGLLL